MGAVFTQLATPLFAVSYARVPFVDVINTMSDPNSTFTVMEYHEWGNPANETQYRYMRSYDPYNNLEDKIYPHLVMTSGRNDPRVNYWEPTKFVAKLRYIYEQRNWTNESLVLLHTTDAGHGGASGSDYYGDKANQFAFILNQIGYTPVPVLNWIFVYLGVTACVGIILFFAYWISQDKKKDGYTKVQ